MQLLEEVNVTLQEMGGITEPLRIHKAFKEVNCAMFEDATITAVLGTVLYRGGSQTRRGKQRTLLISHRKLGTPPAKGR